MTMLIILLFIMQITTALRLFNTRKLYSKQYAISPLWTPQSNYIPKPSETFYNNNNNTSLKTEQQHSYIRSLIIDNFDSYTFNIWQIVADINKISPDVVYNDNIACLNELRRTKYQNYDCIILSPGPGTVENPLDFGICKHILLESPIPVLGVCLGHQGLAYTFGGTITKAPEPVHGRIWSISHNSEGIFKDLPKTVSVVRYHSLIVAEDVTYKVPSCLEVTARTSEGLIMGLRHRHRPLYGKLEFIYVSLLNDYL